MRRLVSSALVVVALGGRAHAGDPDPRLEMQRCDQLLTEQSTEAGACYRAWVTAHPTDRDVDLMRFNGAFAFMRHKRADDAVALLSALVAHAKEGALVARALWMLAQIETDRGHPAVAAGYDERLAREFPKDEHGLDALHNAALLRLQLDDCKAATAHARTLAKRVPPDHEEARFAANVVRQCSTR